MYSKSKLTARKCAKMWRRMELSKIPFWPATETGFRGFLGLSGYYRLLIKGSADKSAVLYAVKSVKDRESEETETAEGTLEDLTDVLTLPRIIDFTDFNVLFVVETDALYVAPDTTAT